MNKWAMYFLVLAAAVHLPAETNTPVRLAMVSESSEAMTAADVLTAQLSGNDKIQLLERDQIEKVYREQGTSEANRNDVKVGRILGADGLLLLDVVRTTQTTNLTARLIAVKPGVVLTDGSFPWPLKDTAQWADSAVTYLDSFLPKLTVLAKDAIPISIANLRASVSSTDEQETERDLKLLTIQRLSQEPRFFVLERQKMQLLSREKELKSDESTFWDGSYLLDGIVDQNGYSKDTVTINARLTPPKGGARLSFEVSGSRTNIAEVINRLAAKVAELLNVHSTMPPWSADNEAAQYYEEAKWALRWGLYSEAQAAADSSWALGKQDMDSAFIRVRSYWADAKPAEPYELYEEGTFIGSTASSDNEECDSFIRQTTNAYPMGVIFKRSGDVVGYAIIKRHPDSLRFASLVRALELYKLQLDSLQLSDPETRKEWCELGTDLLETTGRWLRDYYLIEQARVEAGTCLNSARQLCREIAASLITVPEADNECFWDAEGVFGVFWCETPDEGIELYSNLFCMCQFAPVRKHVMDSVVLLPMLADWKRDDHTSASQLWQDLVDKLCVLPDQKLRANGYFFVCAETEDVEKFETAFEKMRRLLYGENAMVCDIDNMFVGKRGLQGWEKLENKVWRPFRESEYSMAESINWSPKRTKVNWVTNQRRPQSPSNSESNLAGYFSNPANAQFPPTTKHPPQVVRHAIVIKPEAEAQPTNVLEVTRFWEIPLPKTVTLTNTYTYQNVDYESRCTVGAPSSLVAFCYREGYLWVEAEHEWGQVHPHFFFQVNLRTFTSERIAINKNRYYPEETDWYAGAHQTFEVYNNYLYVSSSDGIKRYSLARKIWEDLPVPVGGHARITAFDGRIFLSSANAILEMSLDGQTSKILASTRRRPAKTVLDESDDYTVKVWQDESSCRLFAPVLPGPEGCVLTLVKGTLYMMPSGTNDWKPLMNVPSGQEAERSFSTNGIFILLPPVLKETASGWYFPGQELFLLREGSVDAERIFADKPDPNGVDLKACNIDLNAKPARWTWPEGYAIAVSHVCLDQDTVWVLCGEPGDKTATLFHFLPGHNKPLRYVLRFKRPAIAEDSFLWRASKRSVQVESTPEGILVGCSGAKGFPSGGVNGIWLIPAADLQRIDSTGFSK